MEYTYKGKTIKLDPEDLYLLLEFKWYFKLTKNRKGYYLVNHLHPQKNFHRAVVNCPKNMTVDHINGDKLDNRKENLRICTAAENSRNFPKPSKKTTPDSKYIGVSKMRRGSRVKRWRARVRHKTVGYYLTEEEAAIARDIEAIKQFGEFANLNFKK